MTAQSVIAALCSAVGTSSLRYTEHYEHQLFSRPTPTHEDIRYILCEDRPRIIEDNQNDPRFRSYLIWGIMSDGRVGHILCTDPPNARLLTAYLPAETKPHKWRNNYQTRA